MELLAEQNPQHPLTSIHWEAADRLHAPHSWTHVSLTIMTVRIWAHNLTKVKSVPWEGGRWWWGDESGWVVAEKQRHQPNGNKAQKGLGHVRAPNSPKLALNSGPR